MPDEQPTADLVADLEVGRLLRRYADLINRRAWDELFAVFTADVDIELDLVSREPIRLSGIRGFRRFIEPAMADFDFFQFVVLNHVTEVDPHRPNIAYARVFMSELRRRHGERSRNDTFGVYTDRYRRGPEGWRIDRRRYRSLARFPEGEVFPLQWSELAPKPSMPGSVD